MLIQKHRKPVYDTPAAELGEIAKAEGRKLAAELAARHGSIEAAEAAASGIAAEMAAAGDDSD